MSMVFTKENFEEEVLKSDVPVIVDFWASWCGPCKMVGPVIEDLANELAGQYKVGKVNTDDQIELAMSYGVVSIPTIMVFKDGQVAARSVGAMMKDDLKKSLGI